MKAPLRAQVERVVLDHLCYHGDTASANLYQLVQTAGIDASNEEIGVILVAMEDDVLIDPAGTKTDVEFGLSRRGYKLGRLGREKCIGALRRWQETAEHAHCYRCGRPAMLSGPSGAKVIVMIRCFLCAPYCIFIADNPNLEKGHRRIVYLDRRGVAQSAPIEQFAAFAKVCAAFGEPALKELVDEVLAKLPS